MSSIPNNSTEMTISRAGPYTIPLTVYFRTDNTLFSHLSATILPHPRTSTYVATLLIELKMFLSFLDSRQLGLYFIHHRPLPLQFRPPLLPLPSPHRNPPPPTNTPFRSQLLPAEVAPTPSE